MESARDVQQHSNLLRKELGPGDLILAQILYVVGFGWTGTAAHLGEQHLVFWLAAIVLFYLPLAAVIIHLNRTWPLEGGLYQWAKLGFNEFAGFLVGWNLWLYIILFISAMGVMLATNISYAFGLSFSWIGASRWCIAAVTLTLTLGLAVVTSLGLRVGKWVQNFGAVFQLATFGALILLPLTGRARDYTPLHIAMPAIRTREGALAFSRRRAEVVVQRAAETLSPPDLAKACPNNYGWRDHPVLKPLMVPLVMVVLDEFTNSSAKRTLTEQDQPVQARFLDAPDEAFRVGVQVRRQRGQFY